MNKISTLKQLWEFLKVRKRWWLLPIVVILVIFGILIVVAENSAIAPLLYPLF